VRRHPLAPALLTVALLAVSMSASTAQAASPTLTIVSPADGAVIPNGAPVIVRFVVSDFLLVQPGRVGQIAGPNEGHANVFLDGRQVRLVVDAEPFSLSLSSGIHTIRMQLVDDNGTALTPDVSASVSVTSTHGPAAGVPQIAIRSPAPNERTGHGLYLSYRIENFTLVNPRGQPNAPREGHVQILVLDQVVMEVVQYEPVLLVALPDGDITITARLVNNDGTPLSPAVAATVPLHVAASSAVTLPLVFNGGMALLLAFLFVVLVLRRKKASARTSQGRGGSP
jgi:hypothetical protein